MKKICTYLALVMISLLLCSCIRVVHYVSVINGEYHVSFDWYISKLFVDAKNHDDGGDYMSDVEKIMRSGMGEEPLVIEHYSTKNDYIIRGIFKITNTSPYKARRFLPKVYGDQMIIPLDFNSEYDEDIKLALTSDDYTYSLVITNEGITKEGAPIVRSAALQRATGETRRLKVAKTHEGYVMKFPLRWLYTENPFVRIVLTIDQTYDPTNANSYLSEEERKREAELKRLLEEIWMESFNKQDAPSADSENDSSSKMNLGDFF